MSGAVDWQNINASNDLSNIYSLSQVTRFGNWRVSFHGLFFYCHDLLSFYMAAKDIFIRQIYKFHSISFEPRIIDGGGHIGLFALYAKQQYPNARITIFEPDAESIKLLRLNLHENNVNDAVIIEAGLFSDERSISFAAGQSDGSTIFSESTNATIRTVKLSDYIQNEVDFLKLNIEGAELAVFEEAQTKLHFVKELVLEYHGFPEIGQNLHKILNIIDSSGFRYLIHDFDSETNPATKPPFHIEEATQFYLLIYARQMFSEKDDITKHYNNPVDLKLYQQRLIKCLIDLPYENASKVNEYLKKRSYLDRCSLSLAYPAVWEIETTNRCTMTCNHCPRLTCMKRPVMDMDLSLLKKILDQLLPAAQSHFANGRPTINYMHYGEPALYKWYGESINYAKEKKYYVVTSSTSSALNDKALVAAVDNQLDELWLIFDGMDDETFKQIRGSVASFGGGIEQLNKLLTYKEQQKSNLPEISVIMVKHPANRHQWQYFEDFFGSNTRVSSALAHFSNYAGQVETINNIKEDLSDDPDEQQEALRVAKLNKHTCYYPWHSVSVLADGRVVPCCRDVNGDYVLGDLNKESLIDIWNGKQIQQLRNDFIKGNRNNPLCKRCTEGSLEIGNPQTFEHNSTTIIRQLETIVTEFSLTELMQDAEALLRYSCNEGRATELVRSNKVLTVADTVSNNRINLGDFNRLTPISRLFGGDRMTETSLPLCWLYIREFLSKHSAQIRGRVLEIADNEYTKMFGGGHVSQSDILHADPENPSATIIGDLTNAANIPSNTFDCIICTQTLHVIYDVKAALKNLYRILKPGGVLLASLPGITQISRFDMDRWGDYWRFTTASVQKMFSELWPEDNLEIKNYGNVLTSIAYLHGLVSGDLPQDALKYHDEDYQLMICVCAIKPVADTEILQTADEITLISTGWDDYAKKWAADSFKVIAGESVNYLGDEWTAEDVSAGGTTYGLNEAVVRTFESYLVQELLDPYLPCYAGKGLEIGPGGGRITQLLKLRTAELHVADASEAMLSKLQLRFIHDRNLHYHFIDGMNLPPLAAQSFDYVIAFDVFVHFEPRLIYWYLRQIKQLLKSGGVGIIHYSNINTPIGWQQFENDLELNVRQRTHFASFGVMSTELMRIFLLALGFEVVTTDSGLIPRDAVAVFRSPAQQIEFHTDQASPLVLIYHRISDLPLDPQLLCVSPENFEAHLDELTQNHRVVPLHQMIEECKLGSVPPGTVSITFDDGYLDNLTNALPLLEKYQVHATVFVTSGTVGSDQEFWWDALENVFLTGRELPKELRFADNQWLLETHAQRLSTYDEICSILRDYSPEALEQSLDFIFSWAALSRSARLSHRILNHSQLKQLASSPYIEIGSHAKNHVRLSQLSKQRQRIELITSKQQLEAVVNKTVRLFSYPYGTSADFTSDTVQSVIDAGYHAAIANIQSEVSLPIDLYAIPRRLVRNWKRHDFSEWMHSEDKNRLESTTVAGRKPALLQTLSALKM